MALMRQLLLGPLRRTTLTTTALQPSILINNNNKLLLLATRRTSSMRVRTLSSTTPPRPTEEQAPIDDENDAASTRKHWSGWALLVLPATTLCLAVWQLRRMREKEAQVGPSLSTLSSFIYLSIYLSMYREDRKSTRLNSSHT